MQMLSERQTRFYMACQIMANSGLRDEITKIIGVILSLREKNSVTGSIRFGTDIIGGCEI